MSGEIEIVSGLDDLSKMFGEIPKRIERGTEKGIRKATSEARKLLRAQMSYDGGGTTPADMLGRGTGFARKGVRAAFFRKGDDSHGRVYVASKGFTESPTPGNIAYINVAGSAIRTRGGVLPARSFFEPVQRAISGVAAGYIDDAIAAELVKPLLEVF